MKQVMNGLTPFSYFNKTYYYDNKILFTFLMCAIMTLGMAAQSVQEHLKFAGIPINGTITQFQSKLITKGYKIDKNNNTLQIGIRGFNGTFAGNKVQLYVYYDENTKIVYRVKAVIDGVSESMVDQKYSEIKNLMIQKYGLDETFKGEMYDKETITFYIPSSDDESEKLIGRIDLFAKEYIRYPYNFNLHIDYYDSENEAKHKNAILNDI